MTHTQSPCNGRPTLARHAAAIRATWTCLLLAWTSSSLADEIIENWPNGTIKLKYNVNTQGQKQGAYLEYFEDGTLRVRANYVGDKLGGAYSEFFPNGQVKVKATYQSGQLVGRYTEYALDPSGKRAIAIHEAQYRNGQQHGEAKHYDNGQLIHHQLWYEGELLCPKSTTFIKTELARIERAEVALSGELANDYPLPGLRQMLADPQAFIQRQGAIRLLKQYRFLCDVPHADLEMDWQYTAHAEAGSMLLKSLGRLDHTPPNPGWPEDQFLFARQGTERGNIFMGGNMTASIHAYMDDSDRSNIDRVGHRRWCLNPSMARTGIGAYQGFSALWAMDSDRAEVPDFEYVAFPPRGLTPTSFFKPQYAWSVSPNTRKFRVEAGAVKVSVTPVQANLATLSLHTVAAPLELDYFNVDLQNYGGMPCIIFRPRGVAVKPNSAYAVLITGLKDTLGSDAEIRYFVAFF